MPGPFITQLRKRRQEAALFAREMARLDGVERRINKRFNVKNQSGLKAMQGFGKTISNIFNSSSATALAKGIKIKVGVKK